METATGEALQAAGACKIPFALTTSTGAQVTPSIRFQLSCVQNAHHFSGLARAGGRVQPIFTQDDSHMEFPLT